jgi:hypothetical protein
MAAEARSSGVQARLLSSTSPIRVDLRSQKESFWGICDVIGPPHEGMEGMRVLHAACDLESTLRPED